eukprot:TRINITY_DN6106_c0_g1_i1.p1 TRINITY_DN6106_c0_g1~~TRINITY_DN6106_c0_g1_i1.p1  ORF type:complete len:806 (-),score=53.06 TRINITY_DN6106_c0_g1_i1:371-2788(-)
MNQLHMTAQGSLISPMLFNLIYERLLMKKDGSQGIHKSSPQSPQKKIGGYFQKQIPPLGDIFKRDTPPNSERGKFFYCKVSLHRGRARNFDLPAKKNSGKRCDGFFSIMYSGPPGKRPKLLQSQLAFDQGRLIAIPSREEIEKESKEKAGEEVKKEQKKEQKKQYVRRFCDDWLKYYPWLVYDAEKGLMFCKWCQAHAMNNTMTVGSRKFTSKSLNEHENTKDHKKSIPALDKSAMKLEIKDAYTLAIVNLIKSALFIAREALPNKKFGKVCDLLDKTGCVIPKSMYRDQHGYKEFVQLISRVIENKLLSRIRESVAYGLMLDESIDMVQEEHVIIYCKYYDEQMQKFQVTFLKLLKVNNSKAITVYTELKKYLRQQNLDLFKAVGICTDGAYNMSGKQSGLIGLMRMENPAIEYTHCVVHRLNLVLKDAKKQIPYILRYERVLRSIHSYFSHSALRTENLKAIFVKNEEPFVKIPELFTIRFLALHSVVERVLTTYKEVHEYFSVEQEESRDAGVILEGITSGLFVFATQYLHKILGEMNVTNKILQKEDLSNYAASLQIEILIEKLENNYKKEQKNIIKAIMDELKTGTYQGRAIILTSSIGEDCMRFATEVTELLIGFLKERFPETELLKNLKIVELNYATEKELTSIYGNTELERVIKRFSRCENDAWPPNHLSFGELAKEWLDVKMLAAKLKRDEIVDVESYINLQFKETYPNYTRLMKILNAIPVSTADVERAFSNRTIIKSKYRTSLGAEQLDQLLRIKIEGDGFDEAEIIEKVYNLWKEAKRRQICYIANVKQRNTF